MTGLMPLELSFGVGAAAREPSPKKSAWSSHLDNCAASRIVNGRTRTVTEIEDAPSVAMVALELELEKRRGVQHKLCESEGQELESNARCRCGSKC